MRTTLRWVPPPSCTPARRQELMGPGGAVRSSPRSDVLGTRHEVFVRRLPASPRAVRRRNRAPTPTGRISSTANDTITFAEAARLVANTAAALRDEHGIGHGDRVAIAAANRSRARDRGLGGDRARRCRRRAQRLVDRRRARARHPTHRPEAAHRRRRAPRAPRPPGARPPARDLDEACTSWFEGDAALPTTPIDEDDPFVVPVHERHDREAEGRRCSRTATTSTGRSRSRCGARPRARRRPRRARSPRCRCSTSPGSTAQAIPSVATGTKLVYMPPPGRWTPEAAARADRGARRHDLAARADAGVAAARVSRPRPLRRLEPALDRRRRVGLVAAAPRATGGAVAARRAPASSSDSG